METSRRLPHSETPSDRTMDSSSAFAASGLAPGARRATTAVRVSRFHSPPDARDHTSMSCDRNQNRRGITPTTRYGRPPSAMKLPGRALLRCA